MRASAAFAFSFFPARKEMALAELVTRAWHCTRELCRRL